MIARDLLDYLNGGLDIADVKELCGREALRFEMMAEKYGVDFQQKVLDRLLRGYKPVEGFEPPTPGSFGFLVLQNRCSATELHRRGYLKLII